MTRFTEWRWSFASGDAFVHGFEAALKQEVARRSPDLRFAFSRPGFVTFRAPDSAPARPASGTSPVTQIRARCR